MNRRFRRLALALAFAVLALPAVLPAMSPTDAIRSEIARVEKDLATVSSTNQEWVQIRGYIVTSLDGAKKSLDAGHNYTALEKLGLAINLLSGGKSMLASSSDFETPWRKADPQLKAFEARYAQTDASSAPLALQALAQTDWSRVRVLYNASRGFAEADTPQDGFFYLGQAKGSAEFAEFCRLLQLPRAAQPSALHSLQPELQSLEEKMMAVYKPPHSIEHHAEFIRMHAALKEAGDLEAASLYAGALYKYLDALQQFAALETPAPSSDDSENIKNQILQARRRFTSSKQDDSIAEIFLERAEEGLAAAGTDAERAKRLQVARVILNQVLPAYEAALENTAAPAEAPGKAITVTLVRWPYT